MAGKWILHIDGDGFFAYCEIARFPQFKGKPVVVGVDRGIACAMTYEAKALGVTRGMPIFQVREQFPEVVVLSSHFELYEHYARKLMSIVEKHVDAIERYSIDECFAHVSLPEEWSKEQLKHWLIGIKKEVQAALGITFSFGMARTKVLAKIASKYEKPNGCTIIMDTDKKAILATVAIEDIWGIGRGLSVKKKNNAIRTALDFVLWEEKRMLRTFYVAEQSIWYELNGTRVFAVQNKSALPKSLQSTKSFVPASTERSFVTAELMQNIDIVCSRMRIYGVFTNAISIFFKNVDRRYKTTFIQLPLYTNNPIDIAKYIHDAVDSIFKEGVRYKATGVSAWGLRPLCSIQYDFFQTQEREIEKGNLMKTIDALRDKYGTTCIGLLSALPSTHDRTTKRANLCKK